LWHAGQLINGMSRPFFLKKPFQRHAVAGNKIRLNDKNILGIFLGGVVFEECFAE